MVGFTLALGPFDHVVVTFLHVLPGVWLGASAGYADLLAVLLLATAGTWPAGCCSPRSRTPRRSRASRIRLE